MRYVKASDGVVLKYPFTLADLRADYPGTSFPAVATPELMAEYGIHPVIETDKPSVTIYERAVEADPEFIDGDWRQVWSIVAAPVPKKITPRQCRLILMSQGLLATVEAMIAQQDEATRITWEYASEFQRNDPLLKQLAVNLGLTSEQIDQFFIAAATL